MTGRDAAHEFKETAVALNSGADNAGLRDAAREVLLRVGLEVTE